MHDRDHVTFDVREVPVSCRGSWLGLSTVTGLHTQAEAVHLVSHRNGLHGVLALVPERAGSACPTSWHAQPAVLAWRAADDRAYTWTASVYLTLAADHVRRTTAR